MINVLRYESREYLYRLLWDIFHSFCFFILIMASRLFPSEFAILLLLPFHRCSPFLCVVLRSLDRLGSSVVSPYTSNTGIYSFAQAMWREYEQKIRNNAFWIYNFETRMILFHSRIHTPKKKQKQNQVRDCCVFARNKFLAERCLRVGDTHTYMSDTWIQYQFRFFLGFVVAAFNGICM